MVFKNHGPGGCCCVVSCPSWTDNWIGSNWYDNDDGVRAWDSFWSGTLSLGTNQLLADGAGFVTLAASNSGIPSWGVTKGGTGSTSMIVDDDHAFFGYGDDTRPNGILFDRVESKAYPATQTGFSIYAVGPGETFDPSSTFDISWKFTIDGSGIYPGYKTLEIQATDASSNSIHHRMPVYNGSLTDGAFFNDSNPLLSSGFEVYKDLGQLLTANIIPSNFPGLKEVYQWENGTGPTNRTSLAPEWRCNPFTLQPVSNRYRDDWGTVSERRTVILGTGYDACPLAPTAWLDGYAFDYPTAYLGTGTGDVTLDTTGDLTRTDSGLTPAVINTAVTGINNARSWKKSLSVSVSVPSSIGPSVVSGTWTSRQMLISSQSIVFADTYEFSGGAEIVRVYHVFSAGNQNTAGEDSFDFDFTSTTPFCAFAGYWDTRFPNGTKTITAQDVATWRGTGMLWEVSVDVPPP